MFDLERGMNSVIATGVEVAMQAHATATDVFVTNHSERFVPQWNVSLRKDVFQIPLKGGAIKTLTKRDSIGDVPKIHPKHKKTTPQ